MCEYGIVGGCGRCDHAIKENGFVIACCLDEDEKQRDEAMLQMYEEELSIVECNKEAL